MLEDQVAFLLQKYLGNYVKGLNKEALKISVWQGDVELTNMQLKPEALNALKLPVKVKAGFLGSVRLKVPWSRLGQEPVLVYLDRIFILAEPATHVEGCSEDAVQEAKKNRIREMEIKLLESKHQLQSEMNTSWLGSLVNTIIGNLKLSVTNIHIRYEDLESNPGHPFAAGLTLGKLSAMTVDESGRETFVTGGALDRIQKSAELERLAFYLDSDICPWKIHKPWEDLQPSEWSEVFEVGSDKKEVNSFTRKHNYILQPVTGNAKYSKLRAEESKSSGKPLQKAAVYLDDVTLCLSKDGYRDILKLADNFASFNQRLKYVHLRPFVSVKSDPNLWWKYAYRVVTDQMKKASGELSWEQVLRYASLRKKYISLYASLLKLDTNRMVVDDNKEIDKLDREVDTEVILQWRMLAHKFVEKSTESDDRLRKQKTKKSWWSLGWTTDSIKDDEPWHFSDEDWEQLNRFIGYKEEGYKEGVNGKVLATEEEGNKLSTYFEVHMKHNASKLVDNHQCLAELSCEDLNCFVKLYSEAKVFDVKLGSYRLTSPHGLLAESATRDDSLVGVFSFKPFGTKLDWSLVAKASPCYMTYIKESIDKIMNFFESGAAVSQAVAMETAAAVQMTIDGVKRTAQQQVTRALEDHSRFLLDLDIAAPKITIPTNFCPDNSRATKLLLDLGNLMLRTQDESDSKSSEENDMYLQFELGLSDVSAFLVDGDYHWTQTPAELCGSSAAPIDMTFLPVIDKCGIVLNFQQIRAEHPSYPSTRVAARLPSLGFHFSPARYHRLMQVAKIFQSEDNENANYLCPWNEADIEGWSAVLVWKGVGNREAAWKRRYICLVGPFLYVLENPRSKTYKQFLSLRGKQVYNVPAEYTGNGEHVLAISDAGQSNMKIVEDVNSLILRFDSEDSWKTWQGRFQGAIYRASDPAAVTTISDTSSDSGDTETEHVDESNAINLLKMEKLFVTGVLDELKISFSYNCQSNQGFMGILLSEESQLFEFRAKGGQVELSTRGKDMLIGAVLKSLEIEDLISFEGKTQPRYLIQSLLSNEDIISEEATADARKHSNSGNGPSQIDGEDDFFEASENLTEFVDCQAQSSGNLSAYLSSEQSFPSEKLIMKPPSFSRAAGLLPECETEWGSEHLKLTDAMDSFVKAQIVICDQISPSYNNIDKQVTITLATLSFFCHRPTILAVLEFVNAINIEDESGSNSNIEPTEVTLQDDKGGLSDDQISSTNEEHVVKGLLGKGKSRIIFHLLLNMARAQIILMNESGTQLATLSQDNLLTDIKVFPSSFSVKAALGNLKISDDSLPCGHSYFWVCDMRSSGGSSFVELEFTSYSSIDDDYKGYEYSLVGQLSEVRIVYLNRFIQEIASYFMGLVPNDPKGVVKLKDQVTNSEKWFTTSEIEGSPALKLDLSLRKPIIVMPRRTDSQDYLELDVVHITVQNNFQWLCGDRNQMGAVHMEILTIQVEDINLTVGAGTRLGESIVQDVEGLSVVIRRSLRDLLHQIPATETAIKIEFLKAALSNREYQIISECAVSNISETPNIVPPLKSNHVESSNDSAPPFPLPSDGENGSPEVEAWFTTTVSVAVNLVELSLHSGATRDTALATVQASGAWLLYKSNSLDEGFLSATLKGFAVIDDREGTQQEHRLAIGKSEYLGYSPQRFIHDHADRSSLLLDDNLPNQNDLIQAPTMLILDAKLNKSTTSVSLCVQRPQLLVALDFLLAVAEFFIPTVRDSLSNEENQDSLDIVSAIIPNQPVYIQPSVEFSISPQRPLIIDNERFDHYIYDGRGGILHLQDRENSHLCAPSIEALIYVANGKHLQFKNVHIMNGKYLDSSIYLGANSSYSASEADMVVLENQNDCSQQHLLEDEANSVPTRNAVTDQPKKFIIEFQAIGPELTFYNTSKNVGESFMLSNKLLHAQLDAFCRLVLDGETVDMRANALGLTMESNGVRILEPFDTSVQFSSASGKTNIHVMVSDIFMNFSFSILRLFLAVEEDILAFMRMTSKKTTVICSEFDKVGAIQTTHNDQTYTFWRPRAPPGFAVLGDYLTPTGKPPAKGVFAVNTNFVRVKKPTSFKLIWPPLPPTAPSDNKDEDCISHPSAVSNTDDSKHESCSIWFPEAPPGFVALGCVVSLGSAEPPASSIFCVAASSVSSCPLRDCIAIRSAELYPSGVAFWRVDNSAGSFLLADPVTMSLIGRALELRHMMFGFLDKSSSSSTNSDIQDTRLSQDGGDLNVQSERSSTVNSRRQFEAVASFRLVWWNQGSRSRKKLSIWRPIVPVGMVYLGDIAVQGYEPPNTSIVLHDAGDNNLYKFPIDFKLVGRIKKQRGMEGISFWFPQAPPGFVSMGCIACKGAPKQDELSTLKCIRSDMVTSDQFLDESLWDTSDVKPTTEPFSIWTTGNEGGTFIVRTGSRRPPKRLALRLAGPNVSGSDDTIVDAEIGTFSAALFDDYGGSMVPLFNLSLSAIGFSLHGRPDYMDTTVNFSLAARSYNDKYDVWEPLVEPVDGFLRYQYDVNAPGATYQLRLTCTRELNLNISVSNANMMLQAYASWNNLSQVHESSKKSESVPSIFDGSSIVNIHHRKNYYIIPQNKLGRDLYIQAAKMRGPMSIVKISPGDKTPLKIPVPKNMLDSHLKGKLSRKSMKMVTVIIADGLFPFVEGLSTHQYMVEVHLLSDQCAPPLPKLQSARTCGVSPDQSLSNGHELVNWSETFFFKVDNVEDYMLEMIVTDNGKGETVGFYSSPLKKIAIDVSDRSTYQDPVSDLGWVELFSEKIMSIPQEDICTKSKGRIRCATLLSARPEISNDSQIVTKERKPGFIQISPTRDGPWTTLRLNYATPAACWQLGDDVVASDVSVIDGDRYVNIRSLVSVSNHTDFILDLCLTHRDSVSGESVDNSSKQKEPASNESFETDAFFETEKYNPVFGWVDCSSDPNKANTEGGTSYQEFPRAELPSGWEWVDDWHVDSASVNTADGWVYAPDLGDLKWPETYNHLKFVNYARQRRLIRRRKRISGNLLEKISVGLLKPGDTIPLPLSGVTAPYILQLRPWSSSDCNEYSWSSVVDRHNQSDVVDEAEEDTKVCVSSLVEAEELLHCSCANASENSTRNGNARGLWFCLTIEATNIGKDVHSDAIMDWHLLVKSPLSITNYLPLSAEFSVLEMKGSDQFISCSQEVFHPGNTVKIYNADPCRQLYFSLLPQGGWLPIHEAVLLSDPRGITSKTLSLRSTYSDRIVQVVLEQNHDKENQRGAKIVRIYTPYWFASERCPQLTCRLVDTAKMRKQSFPLLFSSKKSSDIVVEEITDEELLGGYAISSALNFKLLGLSVAITQSGEGRFGPVGDLSSLGDMDGSVDLSAYDADGNCFRLFISSKPCIYSVPTKVISVRPYMTFTNRVGQDMFIKLSSEDEAKVLHFSDSRVSFLYRETGGPEQLQVRLDDTEWCIPVEITKEDTFSLVLRKYDGGRRFLKIEIRGYEDGSRFIVVFRLGSSNGPIRLENRTFNKTINIRQSGLRHDAWIQLEPLSTANFSWEDPYGERYIDAKIQNGSFASFHKFSMIRSEKISVEEIAPDLWLHVVDMANLIIARFTDGVMSESSSLERSLFPAYFGKWGNSAMPSKMQNNTAPVELIIELGVVGLSVIDNRPRELSYLYLERVFVSYSTGYDGGTTSRFKLILGHLQVDNQIPLTLLPVLLAPEQTTDVDHPVFKMTITMSNESTDGTQVYPYVYIRVTDQNWRLSIHEPIIWAIVDFYNSLQLDRVPKSQTITQVDPEIRIDLIDVSEVRFKISLETEPTQRPHGALGVWSPILSAVGNALKLQVHLRKIMRRNKFMRKSSVIPAITNRIWRDLIHNPLHLIFSVDVLGMTSSTLASLSKGFAQLSTDGQFVQLRSKQVWSRRITGVGDGIAQGTGALAQGFAFGMSGVVTKPVESARQNGILGLAQGLGQAFLGFIVQPMSGALDFVSLTVDGIGASCSRCLEVFSNKTTVQRIRNPRAIHADGVVREYSEKEATGQMILYLAEASRHFGCTEIFKEPSKYAWSDYYEDHFIVPYQRIVLVTNKRVMLLQCMSPDKVDKRPCKIMWDVPWEDLMALELAKAGSPKPSHLILHLKNFKRSENFVRLIKCNIEEAAGEAQAVQICSVVHKFWKKYQADMRCLTSKGEAGVRDSLNKVKPMIKSRKSSSASSTPSEMKFVKRTINFQKIWSSEQELKGRCTLCPKQVEDGEICSIWRPICPEGYVFIGDIARVGTHPPNVAALYRNVEGRFASPIGYDLVWRNCSSDYIAPVSIWYPRPPDGFIALGCVATAGYMEPQDSSVFCVSVTLSEEAVFEEQKVWAAPESYPWACHIYQVQSEALQFVALRQPKEESDWKPMRVVDDDQSTRISEASVSNRG